MGRRCLHPKQEIRKALADADLEGFEVENTSAHGHGWGYVRCPKCGQRFGVYSPPRSAGNHANQIRRFIRRHNHEETTG